LRFFCLSGQGHETAEKSLKILSSQKRGGLKGLPIDLSCLPTQSLIFFLTLKGIYSHAFNLKEQVSAFRAKKCGVFFEVESATENSEAGEDIAPQPM
jgi:hypothetical protein